MKHNNRYFAFISYSHKDSELAKWLQHEFEYYELPATLFEERKDLRKEDLPESFRPVFRDEDELAGGELKPQISEALANSDYLIVVCSPNSAKSKYVNNEIEEFINLSPENKRKIFPLIIDGAPHQDKEHKDNECFPHVLLKLSEDKTDPIEIIAGDVKATGRDHAFVKILAGTLKEKDIRFSDLWDKYAIEKAEEERKIREQRDNLLRMQSRFLSEKVIQLAESGDAYTARKIALNILPNHERPYVPEAEYALRKTLKTHNTIIWKSTEDRDYLNDISVDEAGRLVAVACEKTIYIVSIDNGQTLKILNGHSETVTSVCFMPSGKTLVSASEDKTLRLWDLQSGECMKVLEGHTRKVAYVTCSQDGNIASASWDNTIRIWNALSGKCVHILEGHTRNVTYVSFNSSGSQLVSASNDHTVCIWDIKTGQKVIAYQGHQECVLVAVFSNDGKYVASASEDKVIQVWNVVTGECIKTLQKTTAQRLLFAADDTSLILGSSHFIYFWNLATDDIYKCLSGHSKDVSAIQTFDNFRKILSSAHDGTLRIWDVAPRQQGHKTGGHKKPVYALAYSPDGSTFASGSDSVVRIWDVETNECIYEYPVNGIVRHLTYNAQGTHVMSCSEYEFSHRFYICDIRRNTVVNGVDGLEPCFLSDGQTFVYISDANLRKAIYVQRVNQEQPFLVLDSQETYHSYLTINKDETLIASGTYGGAVEVWERATGSRKFVVKEVNSYINNLAFTPSGNQLAFSCGDTTYILNVHSGECVNRLCNLNNSVCLHLVFLSEDQIICSYNDGEVIRWNTITGKAEKKYEGHSSAITSIAIRPSRQSFITASRDKTIKVWNIRTGLCLKTLSHHAYEVHAVILSPDGETMISASSDHSILLWNTRSFTNYYSFEEVKSTVMRPLHDSYAIISPMSIKIMSFDSFKCLSYLRTGSGHLMNVAFNSEGSELSALSVQSFFHTENKELEKRKVKVTFTITLTIWNIETSERIEEFTIERSDDISFATYMFNSKYILYADKNNEIIVWDTRRKECTRKLSGHTGNIRNIIYDTSERLIASSAEDGTVRVWNVDTGDCLCILEGCTNSADSYYLEFHESKPLLILSYKGKSFKLWNVDQKECLLTCTPQEGGSLFFSTSGMFTPDGSYLLIKNRSLKHSSLSVWDIASRNVLTTIEGTCGNDSCSFSPISKDSCSVLTIRNTVEMSDFGSGIITDMVSDGYYLSAAFFPDNKHIICQGDEMVTIFDFKPLDEIISEERELFSQVPLTLEERRKFYLA